MKILFVDDSPDDVDLELWTLRGAGLQIDFLRVETAAALIDALRDFQPDLVISDVHLPTLDGPAARRIVRDVPFLFVSGSVETIEGAPFVSKNSLNDLPAAVRKAVA